VNSHLRYKVIDCFINGLDFDSVVELVLERAADHAGGYVCFSNVHTIVTARTDYKLRDITNNSFLSLPDGRPLSIVGRLRGVERVSRVAGPDFMLRLIGKTQKLRHYFYGSTPEVLERLITNLCASYPELQVVGAYSPPFRLLSVDEKNDVIRSIRAVNPDFVWIGLGAPKQEYWMSEVHKDLQPAILFGVGAAFDFHAGQIQRAPNWMRQCSLEWLHRLWQEPRRLWKRYLVTNSQFLYYLAVDLLRFRNY
jgi:N-acetylglucosaminyldiphosphoundecaprenol N-acetyl-beta-D-mannosaminyltransferase